MGSRGAAGYALHTLAWEIVHGAREDHLPIIPRNGDYTDIRIENLAIGRRTCVRSKGLSYRRTGLSHKRNPSGVAGVRRGNENKSDGTPRYWKAYIFIRGKEYYLGMSKDIETAIATRHAAWDAYRLRGEIPQPKPKRNKEP